MTRPPARPVANLTATATAPALAAPASQSGSSTDSVSAMPATASPLSQFVAPSFSLHSPEDQYLAHYWPQIILAAIVIIAVGICLIGVLSGLSSAARNDTASSVSAAGWSRQSVSPSGRSLTLYEPSRGVPNSRMEFNWVPDTAGVGWVFRTRDVNNYYAARLSMQRRGTGGVLVAEHFSVLRGAKARTREK